MYMSSLIRVNSQRPEESAVKRAAQLIKCGGVIVYPTDTLYGLGANALNPQAVLRIFKIKDRSPDQPLPVVVSNLKMAEQLASVDDKARKLIAAFWPGALTLVMPKKPTIPSAVAGGGNSIGLRAPNHPVPLAIIREANLPLVATSANKHGAPSPVEAEEALKQIGEEVDLILDCGHVGGQSSTVIDLTKAKPLIVRCGPVTQEMIEKVIGSVESACT